MVTLAGLVGCAASPPKHFTQNSDEFTPCSSAPHCVSSQAQRGSGKYVKPFTYTGSADSAREVLITTVDSLDNAKIARADERFIHATFSSTLGFVDDVTFLIQPQQHEIDVKSSSRIGYYDFGVNRKRVERLRTMFESKLAAL